MEAKALVLEFMFGSIILVVVGFLFYAIYKELCIPRWQRMYNFIDSYYKYQETGTFEERREELHSILMKMHRYDHILAWRILGAYDDKDILWFKRVIK
jgi:hypothetical protein